MKKKLLVTPSMQESFLQALWELSIFDKDSLVLFEKAIKSPKKNATYDSRLFQHIVETVTTARNRNLINKKEQDKLKKSVVGFFGLSVGSHAALTWMMESRAHTIKICDPDSISPTNLNRLRCDMHTIFNQKTSVIKKQLQSINPYTTVISTEDTSHKKTEELFNKRPSLHIVVDAVDNLDSKVFLRKLAKKKKIPVLMATDVGDNILIDVERYDLLPQPDFFLGRVKNLDSIELSSLSEQDRRKIVINIVGFEHNSEQMLDSLFSIGTSLPTWPQLGATATIAGGILTTVIKKIILSEDIQSGRYVISLDETFVSDFNSERKKIQRKKKIQKLRSKFGLVKLQAHETK